jgi:hypothetical protein
VSAITAPTANNNGSGTGQLLMAWTTLIADPYKQKQKSIGSPGMEFMIKGV